MSRRPAMRRSAAFLALALACGHGAVAADCTPPTPPDVALRPAKPVPPVKGPCVDAPSGPGCKGWEPYTFNDEVRAFNAKLPAYKEAADAYVTKLNAFVQASGAYARCEVDAMR